MPFDRSKYPPDWDTTIRARIRSRSGGRCEGPPSRELDIPIDRCEARQGQPHPLTGSKVVLTIAHIHDPDPMNCSDSNLRDLCQRCHLNHDRRHHIAKGKANRRARRACGDLFLTPPEAER